jgi:hypothetical protein
MRGLFAFCACIVLTLAVPAVAGAALEVRLAVTPVSPEAGQRVDVRLRTYTPFVRAGGSCCRLIPADPRGYPFRVQAVSPQGRVIRVRLVRARAGLWRGAFRFSSAGRWQLRVANYGPSYRGAPGSPRLFVVVRRAAPAPPSAGFGVLGRPGCAPPSPRNRDAQRFPALGEVFGTAVGGQLWALFFRGEWASSDSAVLAGVVGEEVKIVFRITGFGKFAVAATGPDDASVGPVWGPVFHPSSSWTRPGREWGASFVFAQPGCWRIRATHGDVAGDVWVLVKS